MTRIIVLMPRRRIEVIAWIVIATSLLVIVGWVWRIPVLTSLHPAWPTMKLLTALCFVLAGLSLWLIARVQSGPFMLGLLLLPVVNLVIFWLMGALLVSNLLGLRLGLEELFVREAAGAVGTGGPGRPSVGTMLAFLITSGAGLLCVLPVAHRRRGLRAAGACVAALGVVALAGYVVRQPQLYYVIPQASTGMAVLAAALCALLGAGLWASASCRVQPSAAAAPPAFFPVAARLGWIGGLLLSVAVVIVLAGSLQWARLHQRLRLVFDAQQPLLDASHEIQIGLLEITTGLRAYLQDHDPSARALIQNGQETFARSLAILTAGAGQSRPEERRLLARVEEGYRAFSETTEQLMRLAEQQAAPSSAAASTGRPPELDALIRRRAALLQLLQDELQPRLHQEMAQIDAQISAIVRQTNLGSLLMLCAGLVGSVWLGVVLAQSVTRPIARLTSASEAAAQGAWAPVAIRSNDEFQALAQAFNAMVEARQQAERALQRSEERFTLAVRGATDGLWDWNVLTGEVWYSARFKEMLGYAEEEFPPRLEAWEQRLHPEDHDQVMEIIRRHQVAQVPYDVEYRLQRKDATYRWFRARGVSLRGPDGRPVRMAGSLQDIADRKEALRTIEAQAAQLRLLLTSMAEGLYEVDLQGRCTFCNPACLRLLGYRHERELLGQHMHTLIHHTRPDGQAYPVEACRIYQAFRAGEGIHADDEVLWRADGSSFPVEYWASPVFRDGRVTGSVLSFIDITQRTQAQRLVAQRTAQLEAANKELEAFSYSVSHDLRAPLRAIDGFSRLLLEEYDAALDDEGRRLLGVVRENTRKMGMLIDDLLAFSRSGRAQLTPARIDMAALAQEVWTELQPTFAPRTVHFQVDPLPAVRGDRALLRQVVMNLLANAVKYTRPRAEARIIFGARREGGEAVFYVQDNGVGFDMQYRQKLFGVFQRLHRAEEFEGTGVGLAIVQRVVTRHEGRVWAEGRVDEGATFYFALPLQEET